MKNIRHFLVFLTIILLSGVIFQPVKATGSNSDVSTYTYVLIDHDSSLTTFVSWTQFLRTHYPRNAEPIGQGRDGYYWAAGVWVEPGYCGELLCNGWGDTGLEIFDFPITRLSSGSASLTINTRTPATYSWFQQVTLGVYINNEFIGTVTTAGRGQELNVSLEFSSELLTEGNNNIFIVYNQGIVSYGRMTQVPWVSITYSSYPEIIPVMVDIKPGSYPNSINLKSKGKLPVAILTTNDFDVSIINPETVIFSDAPVFRWIMEDVDEDGDIDLLFHFKTQLLNLNKDSTEAILTGRTFDEILFEGSDMVKIVGILK
jgi:hypothetical protein